MSWVTGALPGQRSKRDTLPSRIHPQCLRAPRFANAEIPDQRKRQTSRLQQFGNGLAKA
jgi:hypothetical protein